MQVYIIALINEKRSKYKIKMIMFFYEISILAETLVRSTAETQKFNIGER